MEFSRRDIILIVGLILVMIGLIPFMMPIYAVIIVIVLYVGIKIFVARRNQSIYNEIGPEGICMDCGGKISNGRCAICDEKEGSSQK